MLILICGLPRAGKTTYSQRFENIYTIIHFDRYNGTISKYVKEHNSENIVIDGIYNKAKWRQYTICSYKKDTKCIWLDTSEEIRKKRPKYPNKLIPFEPPTYDEGWDEIYIIKDNGEPQLLPKP